MLATEVFLPSSLSRARPGARVRPFRVIGAALLSLGLVMGPFPARLAGAAPSGDEVGNLLNTLFGHLKRNYLEIMKQELDSRGMKDPSSLKSRQETMADHIAFFRVKSEEFQRLSPKIRMSYPAHRGTLDNLLQELSRMNRRLDDVAIGLPPALQKRARSRTPPKPISSPVRVARRTRPWKQARRPRPRRVSRRRQETLPRKTDGVQVTPITLSVRNYRDRPVEGRPVEFILESSPEVDVKAILLDRRGNRRGHKLATRTDAEGEARVELKVMHHGRRVRVERTVTAMDDRTVCRMRLTPL